MAKYLDNNGLLYFWQQLKTKLAGKVDVETGKGLSTNDFTTALKSKLEGIEASADVNIIESITYNGTAVPITSKTAAVTGPTKTSDLTNDSGFITSQDISGKLDKSGGTMTGTLTLSGAPTANLHAATKKYVDDAIATSESGAAKFQGDLNAQSTLTNANYKKGWYWVVGTVGTYAGQVCEVGDMVYAIEDKGASYSASDFTVIQTNLDIASITNAEIDTILAS